MGKSIGGYAIYNFNVPGATPTITDNGTYPGIYNAVKNAYEAGKPLLINTNGASIRSYTGSFFAPMVGFINLYKADTGIYYIVVRAIGDSDANDSEVIVYAVASTDVITEQVV